MTAPDERNPLARALDEAGDGPEARGFSVSVEAVQAGVRRRRARRAGVTSGLAVLVIAVIAGGAYAGVPGWGGPSRIANGPGIPAPAGTSAALADWPAQFERCGRPVGDTLPNVGETVEMTVAGERSVAADGTWDASVVVDVPGAPAEASAVVWGTDLSVIKDGVVVGVQDGTATPDLSLSINERLGGNALPTSPFPVTTKVSRALVSCSQYPDAKGSPNLAPGTYQLVVTQTLSYATQPVDPAPVDVRASATTTVTITAPDHPATADPTACGASVDEGIAALTSLAPNPGPIQLTVPVHPTPGPWYPFFPGMPTLTNLGSSELSGVGSAPTLVAVRDGVVVGRAQRSSDRTSLLLAPGGDFVYPGLPLLERCPGTREPAWGGAGLAAGDYTLFVVVEVSVSSPKQTWQAAAGPIPWTVSEPASPPDATASASATAQAIDPVGAVFSCGQPAQVSQDIFSESELVLSATLPADGWVTGVDAMPAWTAQLQVSGRDTITGTVDAYTRLAFTDDAGTVIGRTVSGDWDSRHVTLRAGEPLALDGYGWPSPCQPDGSLGAVAGDFAHMWVPAGTYWAYPFVTFAPADGGQTWVVVGKPSEVTFTGS